jgi:hypothetical protein
MSEFAWAVFIIVLLVFSALPLGICWLWSVSRLPPRWLAQLCTVWVCWDSHYVGYASWAIPFFVYQLWSGCSWGTTTNNYMVFAATVGHPLVIITGLLKHLSYYIKQPWCDTHQGVCLAVHYLLAAVAMVYVFHNDQDNFAVIFLVSFSFCVYTFITCRRPELTGKRVWSEELRGRFEPLLALCRDYLSLQIIVDGVSTGHMKKAADGSIPDFFPKGKGCVIGFAPHGLLPVTAGLMIHSPEWKKVSRCSKWNGHCPDPYIFTDCYLTLSALGS